MSVGNRWNKIWDFSLGFIKKVMGTSEGHTFDTSCHAIQGTQISSASLSFSITLQRSIMTKSRKRKVPITSEVVSGRNLTAKSTAIGGNSSSSSSKPQSSRTVIRKFHVLLKRKAQLEKQKACAETSTALDELDREVEELGGLAAYQRMSSIGQGEDRGGGSEKVFLGWLREMEMHKREGSTSKLRSVCSSG